MSGVNKVILLGRIGQNPEVKHLESGATVANFSIATSEKYTDKSSGEVVETTTWHNLVAWKGLAEVVEKYVKKGDMIYVEGKLQTRTWEKDGEKKYATDILVSNLQMLSSKTDSGSIAKVAEGAVTEPTDLPF
jgi:single-strand DNA-binding protein